LLAQPSKLGTFVIVSQPEGRLKTNGLLISSERFFVPLELREGKTLIRARATILGIEEKRLVKRSHRLLVILVVPERVPLVLVEVRSGRVKLNGLVIGCKSFRWPLEDQERCPLVLVGRDIRGIKVDSLLIGSQCLLIPMEGIEGYPLVKGGACIIGIKADGLFKCSRTIAFPVPSIRIGSSRSMRYQDPLLVFCRQWETMMHLS
jgi:hypothetical protein